jgi:hypothetical protein
MEYEVVIQSVLDGIDRRIMENIHLLIFIFLSLINA